MDNKYLQLNFTHMMYADCFKMAEKAKHVTKKCKLVIIRDEERQT